jgi:hypothetical protein
MSILPLHPLDTLTLFRTRGGGGGLGQRESPTEQQRHNPDHGAGRQRQRTRLREDLLQRLPQGERVGQSLLSQGGRHGSGLWCQFAGRNNSSGLGSIVQVKPLE